MRKTVTEEKQWHRVREHMREDVSVTIYLSDQ